MATKLENLHDLLIHELNDIYSAEDQILEALPKMVEAANSPALAQAFRDHLAQTKQHVTRLGQCFKELGEKPEPETCAAMKGILAEGAKLLKMKGKCGPAVFDAALIGAAQRVEHYEMAAYGCVRTYAKELGLDACAKLLQTTLDEEGAADHLLTQIAEKDINLRAEVAAGASAAG